MLNNPFRISTLQHVSQHAGSLLKVWDKQGMLEYAENKAISLLVVCYQHVRQSTQFITDMANCARTQYTVIDRPD